MRLKRKHTHAVRHSSLSRRLLYLSMRILLAAILGVLAYQLASTPLARGDQHIALTMDMGGYDTSVIHAQIGQNTTIHLTSLDHANHPDGGGQHQFAVDALGIDIIAPPLGSEAFSFTFETPGVYTYYCDTCCGGRSSPTMQGTLVVAS